MGVVFLFPRLGLPVYLIHAWEGHRLRNSAMQGMLLMVSIGNMAGSFLARPFLPDLSLYPACDTQTNASAQATGTQGDWAVITNANVTQEHPVMENSSDTCRDNSGMILGPTPAGSVRNRTVDGVDRVRFAYVAVGCLMILPVISFLVVCAMNRNHNALLRIPVTSESGNGKAALTKSINAPWFRPVFLTFVFFCIYAIFSIEFTMGSYLAPMTVKGLGWPNRLGSLITALYYGSHGVGRLLGVLLALRLSPRNFLLADVAIVAVGLVLLVFGSVHEAFVWIAAVVVGLGCSTFYASLLSMSAQHIQVTGWAGTLFQLALTMAQVVFPVAAGNLLESFGHPAVVYLCLGYLTVLVVLTTTSLGVIACSQKGHVQRELATKDTGDTVLAGDAKNEEECIKLT